MKKLLILCLILCGIHNLNAQEIIQRPRGYHQHKGFYLSMNMGPVFGNVIKTDDPYGNNSPTRNFSGTGVLSDVKIGVAIYENIILHVTSVSHLLSGPTVTTTFSPSDFNPTIRKMPDSFSINESMVGIGFTRYLMPANFYLSASVGTGFFTTVDTNKSPSRVLTDPGFSMQIKVGKEWWIAKNWGLGLGLSYGKTKLRNLPANEDAEKFNSNRIGINLSATFN